MINIDRLRAQSVKNHKIEMEYLNLMESVEIFYHTFVLFLTLLVVGGITTFVGVVIGEIPVIIPGLIFVALGVLVHIGLMKISLKYMDCGTVQP
jgi:hypothetical protein